MNSDNYFANQAFESILAPAQFTAPLQLPGLSGSNLISPKTIAFVDSQIDDATIVMANLSADVKILLDPNRDGITQITAALKNYQGLSGIDIISHGNSGDIQLGNSALNTNSLPQYATALHCWRAALAPTADILFYGCNVAAGASGQDFINQLGKLTGADIAASTNTTGNSATGGDWTLEYTTGAIETQNPLATSFTDTYHGTLATTFLSDLTATAATNGWGPIEKDKSNGENALGDGRTLTLNGVTYAKGLGTHAGSDTTYALGGNYTRFMSDIGVDDEVGNNGSIVFQVWTDGVQIYDSGTMTGATATKTLDLDVTSKQNLRLVVTDAGNGVGSDHGDWANARLESGSPAPDTTAPTATLIANPFTTAPNSTTAYTFTVTYSDNVAVNVSTLDSTDLLVTGPNTFSQLATFVSATPATNGSPVTATYTIAAPGGSWDANEAGTYTVAVQSNQVRDTSTNPLAAGNLGTFQVNVSTTNTTFLSDLTATAATNGWGAIEKDKSNGEQGATDGNTLTLNGVTYAKGLGTHAGSDTTYALTGNYTRFKSDIGVDDEVGNNGSVVFQVLADGVQIYTSGTMTGATATKTIDLDVTGKQNLRLVVTDAGNGNGADHADWANARLESGPPTPDTTAPTATLTANPFTTAPNSTTAYTFTVTYSDNVAVNVSTIDSTDLLVTGPNTFSQLATFVSATPATNGSPVTATYTIAAPGGGWDATEAGTYTVAVQSNQVRDTSTNPLAAATLGTFQVNVSTNNTTFLSDLTATAATNAWGPIEKDKSNGENALGDGRTLTLNGVTYAKGLGTHANSDTTYALGGNYTRFMSDIGVDDEVGNNGSVIFQVWTDGVQIYDSGTMTGVTTTKSIDVDVTGKQNLRLVVTDAGNGVGSDHGDWANARLQSGPSAPDTTAPTATLAASPLNIATNSTTPYTFTVTYSDNVAVNVSTLDSTDLLVTGPNNFSQLATFVSATPATNGSPLTATYTIAAPGGSWDANEAGTYTVAVQSNQVRDTSTNPLAAGNLGTFQVNVGAATTVYLSDLTATAATNAWGPIEKDKSNGENAIGDGRTLTLNGVTYAKGLGTHAGSDTTYALGGNYTRFISDIGLDDEVGSNGSVVFQVWADGTQLYNSGGMVGLSATRTVDVDVTGKQNLRLVVTDGNNGNGSDHADWANARLESGQPVNPNPGTIALSGNATQNQTLSAAVSDLDGVNGAIKYQWQQSSNGNTWTAIAGANNATLRLAQAQVGDRVRVNATYIDTLGNRENILSTPTLAVANVNDLGVSMLSGSATIDGVLKTTAIDDDGLTGSTINYQWQQSTDGTTWTSINGATAKTLTLNSSFLGKQVRSTETYTDAQNTFESIFSAGATIAALNPIVIENQKTGTTAWEIASTSQATTEIVGYADATDINKGNTINFKVSLAQAGQYQIDVYRLGYYGGAGGRLVTSATGLNGVVQSGPTIDPITNLVEYKWNNSYTLQTGNDWTSGMYFAKLTDSRTGKQSYIQFVVRDDNRPADIGFQDAIATSQAYNNYGGNSAYNSLTGQRSYQVSFDRPFNYNMPKSTMSTLTWEYNMTRWLESQGYDISYYTNLSASTNPLQLYSQKTFLSAGHDEYWSMAERDNVEKARDNGVNLAFFSANTAYWQVQFDPSSSGQANRVMTIYKDTTGTGIGAAIDPTLQTNPTATTTLFRSPEVNRPENALLGIGYIGDTGPSSVYNGFDYVISNATDPYYAHTGLNNGDKLTGLVGLEWDGLLNNGLAPAGLVVLSQSPVQATDLDDVLVPAGTNTGISNSVRYTAASGAKVFSIGSIQWLWGLDSYGVTNPRVDPRAQQFAVNVFADMGAKPKTPNPGIIV